MVIRRPEHKGNAAFRMEKGRWSLLAGRPEWGIVASCSLEADGRVLSLDTTNTTCSASGRAICSQAVSEAAGIRWTVTLRPSPADSSVTIGSTVTNVSARTVRLGKCCLLRAGSGTSGQLFLGPDPGKQTFFDYHEDLAPHRVKRLDSDRGRHDSDLFCHVHDPAIGRTFFAAFETLDRLHAFHELTFRKGKGIVSCRAVCDFNGYCLGSGESISSETLRVELSHDPFGVLERWADRLGKRYRPPIPRKAPVGWCGFAWADCWMTETYEDVVRRNADAVRARLAGFDVDYVWMSIGNLHECFPGNWLKFNRRLFPGGIHRTLRRLRSLGFKPGFWIAPFWVFGDTQAWRENPESLLRKDDGSVWCSPKKKDRLWIGARRPHDFYQFDPTHPGTIRYLKRVFSAYRRMGLRYYMLDFISSGYLYRHPDLRLCGEGSAVIGPQTYRRVLKAIRDAAGKETHLLSAVGRPIVQTGIMNAARVGTDYGEGRPLADRSRATFVIHRKGWSGHDDQLQNLAATWFSHRRLYLNDINLLTVDRPVPRNEAEMSATFFGMSGSPVMLGDDIARIGEDRLSLIKKCLPRTRDTARAIDLFSRPHPLDYPRVLVLPVATSWDRWFLAAVFNPGGNTLRERLILRDLGLEPGARFWVFDFWDQRYLGEVRDALTLDVPAGSCRLLRFGRVKPYPWVLSTDMHMHQGEVEMDRVSWDPRRLTLSGEALRPRGEEGNLFVIMPPGFRASDYAGLNTALNPLDEAVIIVRHIRFSKPRVPWRIPFRKTGVRS